MAIPEHRPIPESPGRDDNLLWDIALSVYHLPILAAADELGVFAG